MNQTSITDRSPQAFRNLWSFEVPINRARRAAKEKLTYHRGREAHYREVHQLAERDLRETGITIDDSGATLSNRSSYAGNQVIFDQSKVTAIQTATNKVREHQAIVRECEAYTAALDLWTETTILMTVDDVRYFGIGSFEQVEGEG